MIPKVSCAVVSPGLRLPSALQCIPSARGSIPYRRFTSSISLASRRLSPGTHVTTLDFPFRVESR